MSCSPNGEASDPFSNEEATLGSGFCAFGAPACNCLASTPHNIEIKWLGGRGLLPGFRLLDVTGSSDLPADRLRSSIKGAYQSG